MRKPTILYVEDEAGIRKSLSRVIRRFSSEVYVASDGLEGLELYKKHKPDIVISDIKMPNMNGIDMVQRIKNINPKQMVVFTTAHRDSGFFLESIEMQVEVYIMKPVNLEKLEEKILYLTEILNLRENRNKIEDLINKTGQSVDTLLKNSENSKLKEIKENLTTIKDLIT